MKRIVLAHSGSLASSVAVAWLAERHGAEVITVTLDVGQGRDLAAVRERALALGAVRAHVLDAREEFVHDYVRPALQAGAFDTAHDPVGAALAQSLVACRAVQIARMESAPAVAHAARPGSSAERVLEGTLASLGPALDLEAPARAWDMDTPALLAYARARGIHLPAPDGSRVETNLWGRIVHGSASDQSFALTLDPAHAPSEPAILDLEFVNGVPLKTNGVEMPLLELIESLDTIAGAHGVGRRVYPESGLVVEAPAAVVLHGAHRGLLALALGTDLAAFDAGLAASYADLIVSGRWFTDLRDAIDAVVAIQQRALSGTVRVTLAQGRSTVVTSPQEFAAARRAAASPAVA